MSSADQRGQELNEPLNQSEDSESRHGPYTRWQRNCYMIGGGKAVPMPSSLSCFADEHQSDQLKLSCGGVAMLVAQLVAAILLFILSAYEAKAFVKRAPFAPVPNVTALIEEAKLADHPYSADEISALEQDGFSWTYFRLLWFQLSLVLSVVHRCLLLDASRRDRVAIGIRHREGAKDSLDRTISGTLLHEMWKADNKAEIEKFARELFQWLWFPVSVVGLLCLVVAILSSGAVSVDWVLFVLAADLFPIINTAATALILGSQCETVRIFVERQLEPYWNNTEAQLANDTDKNAEQLLEKFREVAGELRTISSGWKYILGIQACHLCAQLGSTTATVYARHGYQVSLITGQDLTDNQAFFYLVQTLPVCWALWLSFGTMIHLNTYLADVPVRVSRQCDASKLSYKDRNAFAAEYKRLGVHLDVPYLGELTTGSRLSALASFGCAVAAAIAVPSQLKDQFGL